MGSEFHNILPHGGAGDEGSIFPFNILLQRTMLSAFINLI